MKNDRPLDQKSHWLSEQEFWDIYMKVPRLTVEIVLRGPKGIFMTLRNIEPCKGLWHLPGGTVQFAERLTEAVARVAERELGIKVTGTKLLGYIEYPSHFEKGLDTPVGIAFEILKYTGKLTDDKKGAAWYKELPTNIHTEQRDFLLNLAPPKQH